MRLSACFIARSPSISSIWDSCWTMPSISTRHFRTGSSIVWGWIFSAVSRTTVSTKAGSPRL